MAARCSAFERAVFSISSNLEEGLTKINELLCEDIPDDRFATAFLGVVKAGQNRIKALSAGHEPVYGYRAVTRTLKKFPIGGLPLGILKSSIYDDWQTIRFEPDDILVALTD